MIKFSILITTKNRVEDLKITLQKINYLVERVDVECIICDDGSGDGTSDYIAQNYPKIDLVKHNSSRGLLYSRNMLLRRSIAKYAISLDDDAHMITENPLEILEQHFLTNEKCGLIALRIFWGLNEPQDTNHSESIHQVNSFVGCGHVWRMEAWNNIPDYPEWFEFYGEENFASIQLLKNKWELHYFPNILVNHRVNIKGRQKQNDYYIRQRRSFRSGWYLYFMFYPIHVIPKKIAYTFFIQLKNKTFKGDLKSTKAILMAVFDVIVRLPRCFRESNRLTKREYKKYCNLPHARIYWEPNN